MRPLTTAPERALRRLGSAGEPSHGAPTLPSEGSRPGRNGNAIFLATVLLTDGPLTLQGASPSGNETPRPSSITGGSGAYAGAGGFETEEDAPGGSRTEFRIRVTLTFIP